MTDGRTAHPLSWPMWKPRTPDHLRGRSPFDRDRNHVPSLDRGRRDLERELRLMGVTDFVLSTNVALRLDGYPRSGQAAPKDPGVAVYFKVAGRDTVLACDQWDRVESNLRAVVKHIDALRGMDRWGVGTIEQAFAGFAALPPPIAGEPPARPWREVLGVEGPVTGTAVVSAAYRKAAKELGGDDEKALLELNLARDAALRELGS